MTEIDRKHIFDKLTKKLAIILVLFSAPFFFMFTYLGSPEKGRAAAICAFVIMTATRIFWDLRRFVWFWIAISIVVFLHVPLILLVHWTDNNYPGVVLLPGALLDFGIVYGCFSLVEKIMKEKT